MRKFPIIIVLVLLASCLQAQKLAAWETQTQPHVPAVNTYEKVTRQLPADANAETVRLALLEMKPFLQKSNCDLALQHEIESPGGFHYTFQQMYQGQPIYQARIKANLTQSKRMMSILTTLLPVNSAPAEFVATEEEAKSHLTTLYDQGGYRFHIDLKKCYFLGENGLLPAFQAEIAVDDRLWEVILDGQDINILLLKRDLATYARPPKVSSVDTTGTAMVFRPDPLTSSGNVYGGNYTDNADTDSPFLNNERVQVTLNDICYNGTFFLLEGPYLKIKDVEAPFSAPATSTDGNFIFTRADQGFEDAMCYYHIDTYQRYIQSLGFMNLMNAPLTVDPHALNGQDNSHFVPQGGNLRLGFGEGGVDDAEDADVIVHEYGHAISYSAAPGSNGGTERQGLDEGFGDYIAASYSKSLHYASWKNTFTWDGHNEFWNGRSASIATLYPPASTDIYTYGEIWASTLMEVWDEIGRINSDKVFFESLYHSNVSMTLSDAAQIVLDADTALFNGAHTLNYQLAFCRRGIFTGTAPGQSCFVGTVKPNDPGSQWLIFPNPAKETFSINVSDWLRRSAIRYEIVDVMGKTVANGRINRAFSEVPISQLSAGTFLVRLWEADVQLGSKRLNVIH
ncbi:MAG TPA: hypothetical protein ENJ82_09730 [Bacteroidetes bacterium]|nr:hypothetical protein [Bacteroidota bacterium]